MAAGRGLKVAAATAAVGALVVAAGLALRPARSQLAADFSVPDLSGQVVRLSALRGKVVLVNLWATWCPPCREEMPSMERLYQKLAGPDFELLAVSEDEQGKGPVLAFLEQVPVSFPVLLDPERQIGTRYGVWGYPETFVIDREGRIVEHVIGPRTWDAPDQVAALQALMRAPAPGDTPMR